MLGTGDVIDARWEVQRRIGAGGLGAVFLCVDPHDGAEVAVKVLNVGLDAAGGGVRTRVVREARALQRLDHLCIVRVRDVGEDDNRGVVFLVMDYVRGDSLESVERLDPPRVRELVWSLLDALAHAHGQGVAHRDVKPANVLVRADDGVPVLVDWGSAYVPADQRLTRSLDNHGLGLTPQYAPPEALLDPAGADPYLWDVYAVGVLTHVLLTGDPTPFRGEREAQVASAKTLACLDPGPEYDADLRSLVRLATSPAARHRPEGALGALDLLRRPAAAPLEPAPSRRVSSRTIVARPGEPEDESGVHEAQPGAPLPPLDTLVSRPRSARAPAATPAASPEPDGEARAVPRWPVAVAALLLAAAGLVFAAALTLGRGQADERVAEEPVQAPAVEASAPEEDQAVQVADEVEPAAVEGSPDEPDEASEGAEAGADEPASTPAAAPERSPARSAPARTQRTAKSASSTATDPVAAGEAAVAAVEEAAERVRALLALGSNAMAQELAGHPLRAEQYAKDLGRLRAGGEAALAKESLESVVKGLKTLRRGYAGELMRGLGQRGDLGGFLQAVWAARLADSLPGIVVEAIAVEAPLAARSPDDQRDCRTAAPYLQVLVASAAGRRVGWVGTSCATCDRLGAVVEACAGLR